jgi:hypothetical protein
VLDGVAEGLIESGLDAAAAEVYSAASYVLDVLDGLRQGGFDGQA